MKRHQRKTLKMKYNVNIQKLKNVLNTSHEQLTVIDKTCGHVEAQLGYSNCVSVPSPVKIPALYLQCSSAERSTSQRISHLLERYLHALLLYLFISSFLQYSPCLKNLFCSEMKIHEYKDGILLLNPVPKTSVIFAINVLSKCRRYQQLSIKCG